MYVGADRDQSSFQINDHKINQMSHFIYHGPPAKDKGLADNAVKLNIVRISETEPIPRLKVLSIKTRENILEIFIELIIL